jgi:alkylation response protein AidB-like acyl-CoA dehydrogenase
VADLESFRAELREWLEANCPPSMRLPADLEKEAYWGGRRDDHPNPEAREWCRRMALRGFTAPRWPREYGGGGLTREEVRVLEQELRRIHARPPLASIGIQMLGPMLLELGSEEQKREHIPAMVQGKIRWCQGYSEPGAGSDLASLQTRIEDRGDHYVVTGQKIWTSYANYADMIFCLVRSDPSAPKHEGISFVLIDMDQPAIRTSPIQLISGSSPFCQTFFDGARVEKKNLVGKWNGGWGIAKRLLQFERQSIGGGISRSVQRETPVPERAKRYCGEVDGRIADPLVRDRVAELAIRQHALEATIRRSADEARAGQAVGTASSIFKLCGSELNQEKHELLIELMGLRGVGWEGSGFDAEELATTVGWLRSKANTIEGGSSEVQLNIIAKRVLGLPD